MRHLFSLALVVLGFNASAQWVVKVVNDDPFEPAYTICYNTETTKGTALLKMEESDGKILFYTSGGYICDERVSVTMSFKINGEWERVDLRSCMVIKSKLCILSQNLANEDWVEKVRTAEQIAIMINESHCDSERFMFNNEDANDALTAWSKQ